jgi:hypothetical protein
MATPNGAARKTWKNSFKEKYGGIQPMVVKIKQEKVEFRMTI